VGSPRRSRSGWPRPTGRWHSPTWAAMTHGCLGGQTPGAVDELAEHLHAAGARVCQRETDFENVEEPARAFDHVLRELGSVGALALGHCESVATGIMDTGLESFDRHFAVNARAGWLLIREYARQFSGSPGAGRIVALTSDHTAGNLPYSASKGALDRIVIGAARELWVLVSARTASIPGRQTTAGQRLDQRAADSQRRRAVTFGRARHVPYWVVRQGALRSLAENGQTGRSGFQHVALIAETTLTRKRSGRGPDDVGELVSVVEDALIGDVGADDQAELVGGGGQPVRLGGGVGGFVVAEVQG
jgi:3-oxoacyl-[acyl-carrier protein] reductase